MFWRTSILLALTFASSCEAQYVCSSNYECAAYKENALCKADRSCCDPDDDSFCIRTSSTSTTTTPPTTSQDFLSDLLDQLGIGNDTDIHQSSPPIYHSPGDSCCPYGGVWSEWYSASCTARCGLCGAATTLSRKCWSEGDGCSCDGPTTKTGPCPSISCKAYMESPDCCAGTLMKDETSGADVCSTEAFPIRAKPTCCLPGSASYWNEWMSWSDCINSMGAIYTQKRMRSCASEGFGCLCSPGRAIEIQTCTPTTTTSTTTTPSTTTTTTTPTTTTKTTTPSTTTKTTTPSTTTKTTTPPTTTKDTIPSTTTKTTTPSTTTKTTTASTTTKTTTPSTTTKTTTPSTTTKTITPTTPTKTTTPSTTAKTTTPSTTTKITAPSTTTKPTTTSTTTKTTTISITTTTPATCTPSWAAWSEWTGDCSQMCGLCGVRTRKRKCATTCRCCGDVTQREPCGSDDVCTSPKAECCAPYTRMLAPDQSRFMCGSDAFSVQGCDHVNDFVLQPCTPTWAAWSEWTGDCSQSCGLCGLRTRTRKCATACKCCGEIGQREPCGSDSVCTPPAPECCAPYRMMIAPDRTRMMCGSNATSTQGCDVASSDDTTPSTTTKLTTTTKPVTVCVPSWAAWSEWIGVCSSTCGLCGIRSRSRKCSTTCECCGVMNEREPCGGDSLCANPTPSCCYPYTKTIAPDGSRFRCGTSPDTWPYTTRTEGCDVAGSVAKHENPFARVLRFGHNYPNEIGASHFYTLDRNDPTRLANGYYDDETGVYDFNGYAVKPDALDSARYYCSTFDQCAITICRRQEYGIPPWGPWSRLVLNPHVVACGNGQELVGYASSIYSSCCAATVENIEFVRDNRPTRIYPNRNSAQYNMFAVSEFRQSGVRFLTWQSPSFT